MEPVPLAAITGGGCPPLLSCPVKELAAITGGGAGFPSLPSPALPAAPGVRNATEVGMGAGIGRPGVARVQGGPAS